MHPILIQVGPLTIHTYGFLIAIGFLIGMNVVKNLASLSQLNVERVLDLTFWCLLVGFTGSRLLFVFICFKDFASNPLNIFKVWEGGLVFLGGPLAAIPFAVYYMKKHKLPAWRTFDVLAPALVICHAIGRFGCLAAGCCYGKPTGTPYGLRLYSDLVEPELRGVLLHPTQLYEAFSLFALFLILILIFKRKKFDGQVALAYLMGYPIIRSVIEMYRGDLIRGFVIDSFLSTSQFISIFMFIIGLFLMRMRTRAEKLAPTPRKKSRRLRSR